MAKGSTVASLFLVALMAAGFLLILNNVSSFDFTAVTDQKITFSYPYNNNWSANGSMYNLLDYQGRLYLNTPIKHSVDFNAFAYSEPIYEFLSPVYSKQDVIYANDRDFSTFLIGYDYAGIDIYENYTQPVTNATWDVKHTANVDDGCGAVSFYCWDYNSTDWNVIYDEWESGTFRNSYNLPNACLNKSVRTKATLNLHFCDNRNPYNYFYEGRLLDNNNSNKSDRTGVYWSDPISADSISSMNYSTSAKYDDTINLTLSAVENCSMSVYNNTNYYDCDSIISNSTLLSYPNGSINYNLSGYNLYQYVIDYNSSVTTGVNDLKLSAVSKRERNILNMKHIVLILLSGLTLMAAVMLAMGDR